MNAQALQRVRNLVEQGRWQEAKQACQELDKPLQDNVELLSLQGIIHGRLGEHQSAQQYFRRVTELRPDDPQSYNNLGLVLGQLNRHEEALQVFQKAIQLKPDFFEAWFNLGRMMAGLGRYQAALKSFNRALDQDPHHAEARTNAGIVLFILNRYSEAAEYLQQALLDRPDDKNGLFYLGQCQLRLGCFDRALEIFDQLIRTDPHDPKLHHARGNVYVESKQPERALASFQEALRLDPGYGNVYFDMGVALQSLGDLSQANEAHRKAIACDPGNVRAYRSLANNKKFTDPADADLRAMLAVLQERQLSWEEQMFMHFALGKVYEDLSDDDRSFEHYARANKLMRDSYEYDPGPEQEYFERLKNCFSEAFFEGHADRDPLSAVEFVPVFIVGMPRSGTTLCEQILASHPNVYGAGELKALGDMLNDYSLMDLDTMAAALDDGKTQALADRYRQLARVACPQGRSHIVDKMPHNFRFVGFIRLMFPHARVIHCVRNPVDTSLSCYKRYFAGSGVRFAYDLVELGRYYCLYRDLMAHWHRVLPGFVHDLGYEELIADQEGQTRRLLEVCGLPWDQRCLSFYETRRSVTTNSYNQVRQPIYSSSVQSWRRFESHLAPLLDELRHCGIMY